MSEVNWWQRQRTTTEVANRRALSIWLLLCNGKRNTIAAAAIAGAEMDGCDVHRLSDRKDLKEYDYYIQWNHLGFLKSLCHSYVASLSLTWVNRGG